MPERHPRNPVTSGPAWGPAGRPARVSGRHELPRRASPSADGPLLYHRPACSPHGGSAMVPARPRSPTRFPSLARSGGPGADEIG